jgi:hypothetical protein
VKVGVLGALAAFENQRRTDELETLRVRREVSFDLLRERWLSLGQRFIDDDERFVTFPCLAIEQNFFEERVGRIEHMVREMHLVAEAHLNGSLNSWHATNL